MLSDSSAKKLLEEVSAGLDAAEEVPFYIPATGPVARPRRTLKYGDSFIVLDSHGDVGVSADGPDGLFHEDTRHLSRLELSLNDLQPLLLGSNLRDDNAILTVDLANPDLYLDRRLVLPKDTIHIIRTTFIWRGVVYQRIGLRNYGERKVGVRLAFAFDSDFADIFEVRGLHRQKRGVVVRHAIGTDRVILTYQGLDGKRRHTTLTFEPIPSTLELTKASFCLDLPPGHTDSVFLTVDCNPPGGHSPLPFFRGVRAARRELRAITRGGTTVETSNDIFNEVLCRSMADLHMLMTDTPEGRYPYAGIPWYSTTFGRDGLITALQMLWVDPDIARGVLKRLAAYQAKEVDPAADAQPGKILHEMRSGEMAALHEIPFGLYYGSVDSTPLFVLLAGLYFERTGDSETMAALWPSIVSALHWIDHFGDCDQDGFVEYERGGRQGLQNQGWKDSRDAVFHADGSLAQGPIALCEVQGYVFAAKRVIARYARRMGWESYAAKLEAEAQDLAARFETAYWCPELKTYALALDGEKKPCQVCTSNAGQVLFSGIASAERAAQVASGLLEHRFFSGWGIRTVASGQLRYNPMSYHNGSVWPHDNSLIALGLARYDRKDAVERVFTALFEAASYMEFRRLPELFCGFQRVRGQGPTLYPVACSPQAWASATPFALLSASLGLEFDTQAGEIRMRNPHLPAFLDEVVLRRLRLLDASLDVKIRRHRGDASIEILKSSGAVQLVLVHTR
ncbi:Amylo-alpha-1,6-glucosidase [Methylacidimicrobium sp. AP8]|uniref:amylo-alpha-1,6-glucosidase n=1 Tax=Methylacidimicrobium sp. AP8 TaxID=2730359 RepID=UPI0018C15905|nr:amylo-alpha-1,6-glucosidase [Methylacidimicrobium sp. AP8]CAB4243434.1 Amylo-alpha-1,6-glucosidase [Methylacidimicrobium sp. AP8]